MATVSGLYTFTNGTTADATQVTSNFNALKSFVETNVVQVDGTTSVADGSITTAKIADSSITSAKIIDGSITDADINSSAGITLTKLGSGSLPSGITVNSSNIVDGSITAADTNFGGAWTGFTPTATTTTVSASDSRYLVIGKTAHVSIMLTTTGTTTSQFITLGSLPAAIAPRTWSGFQDYLVVGAGSWGGSNIGVWVVTRAGVLEYRHGVVSGSYIGFTGMQLSGTVYLTGRVTYEIA